MKNFINFLESKLLKLYNIRGSRFDKLYKELAEKYQINIEGLDTEKIYRKLILKVHPDKGGDEELFIKVYNTKEKGSPTLQDKEEMYKYVGNFLANTNKAIRGLDTVLDTVKLYHDQSEENVLKLAVSTTQLYGMLETNQHISLGIGAAGAIYQVYKEDYLEAMTSISITVGYTLGIAALSTQFPAIAAGTSIGLTAYSGYLVLNKGYEMLYPSEDSLLSVGTDLETWQTNDFFN